jgi:hypothetical protein
MNNESSSNEPEDTTKEEEKTCSVWVPIAIFSFLVLAIGLGAWFISTKIPNENIAQLIGFALVALIGSGTLIGAFYKMKGGFGPQNLRVVILILVAIFVMFAGCIKLDLLTNALSILGTIIGYIFGVSSSEKKDNSKAT